MNDFIPQHGKTKKKSGVFEEWGYMSVCVRVDDCRDIEMGGWMCVHAGKR